MVFTSQLGVQQNGKNYTLNISTKTSGSISLILRFGKLSTMCPMKRFGRLVWLWRISWLTISVSHSAIHGWRTREILLVSFHWWIRSIRTHCWLVSAVVLLLTNVHTCCSPTWIVFLRSWTILIIRYNSCLQVKLTRTMEQARAWLSVSLKSLVVRNSWVRLSSSRITICNWLVVWFPVLISGWILRLVRWKHPVHLVKKLWWTVLSISPY